MKNNLPSQVRKFVVILTLVVASISMLWSQQDESNEVLVYVKSNTIDVPLNQETNIRLTSESIKSPAFLFLLQNFQIIEMKRAFVNFNLADTIRYSPEGEPIAMLNLSGLFKIIVPPPYERDSVIAALGHLSDVIYAEKNGGWELHTNDQHYTKQCYLKNTGQSGGTVGADIKAENAWQIFTGSTQIKIGIIDSGIKTDHEDLSGKVSGDNPDYNWHDPYWYYSYSHGTHVGGIAGAKTGNGLGIAGVDQNTQIYSRRIFDSQNHQNDDTFIYNAIVDAVNQGCIVLNNSWGGSNNSPTIRYAFAYAYKMNRVAVCSMGNNNGSQTQYPAGFGQGIIAVGSTTDNDVVSTFSDIGNHIDVSAPGGSGTGGVHDIFSTVAYTTNYSYYDFLAGTSMAAPVVTGIASLLKGYNSNLYNDDIEQIIRISADDKGASGWDQYYGTGRVNAYNALRFLQAPYQLSQLSSSGGQVYTSTNNYSLNIYGASGLPDGTYWVKRYEIRKTVNFPSHFDHYVWGRGIGSGISGWNNDSPRNFALGFAGVVSGTVTSNSAVLRTYLYEVWQVDELGNTHYIGWYPTTAQNVTFKYTVLGIPLVPPIISNFTQSPNPMCPYSTANVYVHLSQGNGDLQYTWSDEGSLPAGSYITPHGDYCTVYLSTAKFYSIDAVVKHLKCTVTNSAGSAFGIHNLIIDPNCSGCPTLGFNNSGQLNDENPLLITSLSNPGIDVTDYYLINSDITSVNNRIKFTIHEPQTEHTWLDNATLIETKVKDNEYVAVTDDGEIVNYKKPRIPLRMTLNDTLDVTELLADLDGEKISVKAGDFILIEVDSSNRIIELIEGEDDNMIMGGENPPQDPKKIGGSIKFSKDRSLEKNIKVSEKIKMVEGSASLIEDYGNFFFRPNLSIICKRLANLPQGYLRIDFTMPANLDFLLIAKNLRTAITRELNLISAMHNTSGNVTSNLENVDGSYAEIYPEEGIDFTFASVENTNRKAYILKTVGRYETDSVYLKNKTLGLQKIKTENIIIEDALYDNYPNPFNPMTIIKYSVKEDGLVAMKIYNSIGEEVMVLVNEMKPAGIYEASFDASKLPSGVYFYSIAARDFHQTKKMLLVK